MTLFIFQNSYKQSIFKLNRFSARVKNFENILQKISLCINIQKCRNMHQTRKIFADLLVHMKLTLNTFNF